MADIAALAREYLEYWNRRDWDGFKGILADDYTYTGGDGQTQRGPDAGLAVGQMFATAFPDGKIEFRNITVSGNTAVVEFTGSGTHTGNLMDIPPTGKKMSLPIVTILEFSGDKIAAEREYMDMMHMMTQLGLAPAPATA
jgi:steroid delta-isomerase-like uncharacterized protein